MYFSIFLALPKGPLPVMDPDCNWPPFAEIRHINFYRFHSGRNIARASTGQNKQGADSSFHAEIPATLADRASKMIPVFY